MRIHEAPKKANLITLHQQLQHLGLPVQKFNLTCSESFDSSLLLTQFQKILISASVDKNEPLIHMLFFTLYEQSHLQYS